MATYEQTQWAIQKRGNMLAKALTEATVLLRNARTKLPDDSPEAKKIDAWMTEHGWRAG